jgi:hypothetical protein
MTDPKGMPKTEELRRVTAFQWIQFHLSIQGWWFSCHPPGLYQYRLAH